MGTSIVRIIMNSFNWIAFGVGVILNGILIHLIVRHTHKSMRMYSKILLQTCATDIALLTINLLFHQYSYTTGKVYVSLFGYVAQFIYRYLLLNWNKTLSTFKYFILFGTMLFIPLVYCVDLFVCYYPPTDHTYLEDQSVADILALNINDHNALTGHSFNDWKQTMGFYYIIIACTIAYMIIITLAFLMDKLLKERLKLGANR
uniref:G_PROTEIN_RECEP_F1_2 domain-containing protein n=1 Tax=Globodera pallida TaxID=36090 RepID=A0A183CJG7_GLOPA